IDQSGSGSRASSRTSGHLVAVALDRAHHPYVHEAAAQDAGHALLDFGVRSFRALIDERLRGQDDAVQAEPALRGLLLDERALDRMRTLGRSQTFERRDIRIARRADRRDAGSHRATPHDDRTRPTLS